MNDKNSFKNKRLKEWDSKDISQWLASIGMKPYVSTFKSENITGRHLRHFNEDDLRTKCKITARPVRKILFKRLKHVQAQWKNDLGTGDSDEESEEEVKELGQDSPTTVLLEEKEPQDSCDNDKDQSSNNDVLDDSKREMTPQEAAFKIQSMLQCWKAHQIVLRLIRDQYIKIYSLQTGRYVYKFIGRATACTNSDKCRIFSKLAPSDILDRKPVNLGSTDLSVHFNRELAILRIQLFARYCCTIKVVRGKIRQQWRRIIDPISGKYFFFSPRLGTKSWMKPKLLGRERWDPMEISLWTEKDVQFYFRKLQTGRIGLMKEVERHKIDGPFLLVLEEGDLDRLGIPQVPKKKVLADVDRVKKSVHFEPSLFRKRDCLRGHYRILQAAIMIQRNFRRFITESKFSKLMKVLGKRKRDLLPQNKVWWSDFHFEVITVFRESIGERQKITLLS